MLKNVKVMKTYQHHTPSPLPLPHKAQQHPILSTSPGPKHLVFAVASLLVGGGVIYQLAKAAPISNGEFKEETTHTTIQFGWPATMTSKLIEGVEWSYDVGPWGKGNPKSHTYRLKSEEEVEAMFTQNQKSTKVHRAGNPVVRWDECNVMSSAGEDRHVVDLVTQAEIEQLGKAGLHTAKHFWETWNTIQQSKAAGG